MLRCRANKKAGFGRALKINFPVLLGFLSGLFLFSGNTLSKELSYEDILKTALANNQDLKFEEMKVKEAEARYCVQFGVILPQVDALLSYTHYGQDAGNGFETKPGIIGSSAEFYLAQLTLNQVIFKGGKDLALINSSYCAYLAEKQKLEQVKRDVIYSAKNAYFEFLRSLYSQSIQKELIRRLQEQLGISTLLYESGKISNIDVLKLKTKISSAEDSLISFDNLVKIRSLLLGQVLGLKEPVTIELKDPQIKEGLKITGISAAELINTSPKVNYAKYYYEKAKADLSSALGDEYPSLSLTANFNSADNKLFPVNTNYYIGLNLSFPVFHGGSIDAAGTAAEAVMRENEINYIQAQVNISIDYQSAEATFVNKSSLLKTSKKTLDLARETLTATELSYNTGKLSAMDLIDSGNVWFNAKLNYYYNIFDCLIAEAAVRNIYPDAFGGENKK